MIRFSAIAALMMTPLLVIAADKSNDFSILSQRNIFLRDRRPPPDPGERVAPTTQEARVAAPEPLAQSIVLRGVVIEDAELHAYVENTRSGDIIRLAPGDAVADGHVDQIALDAIAYEQNGQVRWIDVGRNLFGAAVTAPATAPSTTAPSRGAAAAASATPGDPAIAALEQRMRERRLRTQNQRIGK